MLGCGFGFTAIYYGLAADPGDDERHFDEARMMQVSHNNTACEKSTRLLLMSFWMYSSTPPTSTPSTFPLASSRLPSPWFSTALPLAFAAKLLWSSPSLQSSSGPSSRLSSPWIYVPLRVLQATLELTAALALDTSVWSPMSLWTTSLPCTPFQCFGMPP